MEHENNHTGAREGYDLGTFNFLQAGWWILHFAAIAGVFYLGYIFGGSLL